MKKIHIKIFSDILSNLRCAVNDYRGNSSILIGPRSSGKSTLIKQLITEIKIENYSSHVIESLILQGSIFSETQSVLKYLLGKFKGLLNGKLTEIIEETSEDLSEYVRY
jgi:GTPase SAR1 family protein